MVQTSEHGYVFGIGGTNSREAHFVNGDIEQFKSVLTPGEASEFFRWMARGVLQASDAGAQWAVAGIPGPVLAKGEDYEVNFTNVFGDDRGFRLTAELAKADPAVGRLQNDGFAIVAANDGDLAAHAAAFRISQGRHETVADIIIGTGVGGALVQRDASHPNVYRSVRLPLEIGHVVLGETAIDTFENRYAGPAIRKVSGHYPEDLRADHFVWDYLGCAVGKLATTMSLMGGAELVVISGGLGVNGYDKYRSALERFMQEYVQYGSRPQKKAVPEIVPVPKAEAQVFELYGARAVIIDELLSRPVGL